MPSGETRTCESRADYAPASAACGGRRGRAGAGSSLELTSDGGSWPAPSSLERMEHGRSPTAVGRRRASFPLPELARGLILRSDLGKSNRSDFGSPLSNPFPGSSRNSNDFTRVSTSYVRFRHSVWSVMCFVNTALEVHPGPW